MKIPVDSIEIPERVRKDLGDLTPLMESLQKIGQLNPITVTPDFKLVAGHRRLTAVRQLGWKTIEAQIVEGVDELRCLEMELEENLYRKDFTPDEVLAGWKRLDALRHPRLSRRIATGMKKFFSRLAFCAGRSKRCFHDKFVSQPFLIRIVKNLRGFQAVRQRSGTTSSLLT